MLKKKNKKLSAGKMKKQAADIIKTAIITAGRMYFFIKMYVVYFGDFLMNPVTKS